MINQEKQSMQLTWWIISEDPDFLTRICFTDELTFHVSGSWTNTMWGSGDQKIHMWLESLNGLSKGGHVVWNHVQSSYWTSFLLRKNNQCRCFTSFFGQIYGATAGRLTTNYYLLAGWFTFSLVTACSWVS